MDQITTSPIPQKNKIITYSFPDALKELIHGRKITRLEWGTNEQYGLLKDGWLMIYGGLKMDGQYHIWQVNDGDMNATDWILLPEPN